MLVYVLIEDIFKENSEVISVHLNKNEAEKEKQKIENENYRYSALFSYRIEEYTLLN